MVAKTGLQPCCMAVRPSLTPTSMGATWWAGRTLGRLAVFTESTAEERADWHRMGKRTRQPASVSEVEGPGLVLATKRSRAVEVEAPIWQPQCDGQPEAVARLWLQGWPMRSPAVVAVPCSSHRISKVEISRCLTSWNTLDAETVEKIAHRSASVLKKHAATSLPCAQMPQSPFRPSFSPTSR